MTDTADTATGKPNGREAEDSGWAGEVNMLECAHTRTAGAQEGYTEGHRDSDTITPVRKN